MLLILGIYGVLPLPALAPLQSILNVAGGGDTALVTDGGEGSQESGLYSSSPLVFSL